MRRLRICFVTTPWLAVGTERGGIPKVIFELSRSLSKEHEIHVLSPSPITKADHDVGPNIHFHLAPIRELRTYPIPETLEANVRALRLVVRLLFAVTAMFAAYVNLSRRLRFDVTCLTNRFVAIPILAANRGAKHGGFVYSEQNIWPWLYRPPPAGWARFRFHINVWIGRLAFQLSDAIHANSDSIRDALLIHGVDGRRVVAIPNGVEIPPGDGQPEPLSKPLRIAFVGRLVETKGVQILVDTVGRLNGLPGEARFLIFGDGPQRSLFSESRATNFTLVGDRPREEVLDALRSVHIVLFLSPVENIPSLALLEALALGKAVIATNVGDTPRFLSDRENAVLTSPDPDSIARAIAAISEDRALYSKLTSGARALAAAHSWDEVGRKHLELYLSVSRS